MRLLKHGLLLEETFARSVYKEQTEICHSKSSQLMMVSWSSLLSKYNGWLVMMH